MKKADLLADSYTYKYNKHCDYVNRQAIDVNIILPWRLPVC